MHEVLRIGVDHIPRSLNPLVTHDRWCFRIAMNTLFEPLVRSNTKGGFRPHLAASYKFLRGGRLLRFKVRPGVLFHDGRPLTSADVKYTLEVILAPRGPSPLLRSELSDVLQVRTLSSTTVELMLTRTNYLILATLAEVPILPAHLYSRKGLRSGKLNEAPVGTGPFTVAERTSKTVLSLVRNESYWGLKARSPRIELRAIAEPSKALAALRNNELDVLASLYHGYYPKQVSRKHFKARYRVLRIHPYRLRMLLFNARKLPLKDRNMRLAMIQLADRPQMLRAARNDQGQVVSAPLWTLSQWYNQTIHPYTFDRQAAARLMEGAGWKLQRKKKVRLRLGHPLTLRVLQAKESEEMTTVALILRQELAAAGAEAQVEVGDFGFVVSQVSKGRFDMALLGLALRPQSDLSPYLESKAALNYGGYSDPQVDALLASLRTAPTPEARLSLARRLHRALHENPPAALLYTPIELMVADRQVRGLANNGRWPRLVNLYLAGEGGQGGDEETKDDDDSDD